MTLYKTKYMDGRGELKAKWAGSLALASKDRTQLKRDGHSEIETEPVDFNTNKAGIIELLNTKT
jgi:hypothetical protein